MASASGSGEFDLSKFRICEPPKSEASGGASKASQASGIANGQASNTNAVSGRANAVSGDFDVKVDDELTPPVFQRGEVFLRRFMQPSNPGSRTTTQPSTPNEAIPQTPDYKPRYLQPRTPPTPAGLDFCGSNAPTLPSSPNEIDPPTPDTAPAGLDSVAPYEVTLLDFFPGSHGREGNDSQYGQTSSTPNNSTANSTHATPSTSKRSTGLLTTTVSSEPENIPSSSMIVPVMIPDKSGGLMNDEMKIKMVMRFGILVSDYKEVFPDPLQKQTTTDRENTIAKETQLQRRRSVTFMNINPRDDTKPKYLVVDQRHDDQLRTRSSDGKVTVRLLLSVADLQNFPSVNISGKALQAILHDTRDRMSRRPRRFTSDTLDVFFGNTFVACQYLTVVSSQHVMPPLRDKDGTIITVDGAANILGQTYVRGWPGSNTPMVGWYPDDRALRDL